MMDAKNAKIAIDKSNNPYEILQIAIGHTESIMDDFTSNAMVKLLFNNDGNPVGMQVIHAVLNMMRMSNHASRMQLGCHILWCIDGKTPYQKLPPIAFIVMMDEIEVVIKHAIHKFRLSCHECVWMLHAESVLRNINRIRNRITRP